MSRIFDALQRSVAEESGIEYSDLISVVTNSFNAPREQAGADHESPRPAQPTAAQELAPLLLNEEEAGPDALGLPSLETAVTASSRFVFMTDPDSLAAEKFRFLGIRLRHIRQGRPLKKILITSTMPEEGKSLVSANLAGVLARRKEKVLLIEGDLRRPVLMEQFGLSGLAGLGEWLQGDQQLLSQIYHLREADLWFMPAGRAPENAVELMQSGRLFDLMAKVARLFDWIIVDSPPLLPLGDTSVWTRLTDGTVLIAREGKTERQPLQQGLRILKKSDVLGVVLNGCSNLTHRNYYQRYSPSASK